MHHNHKSWNSFSLRPARSEVEENAAHIARIDALTSAGRANWLGLLAYLAFVTVTTLGVEDVDFYVASRETALPLINVSIPTLSFFTFAPVLGAALYAYLHLHIRKLTEALRKGAGGPPPMLFGAPLETHIKPWLLNDFILRQRRDGAVQKRPLDTLATLTTWALVWAAGPFVLGLMWWRGWVAHDLPMSIINAVSLMITIYSGTLSWNKMRMDAHCWNSVWLKTSTTIIVLLCLPIGWLTTANSKGLGEYRIEINEEAGPAGWIEEMEVNIRTLEFNDQTPRYANSLIWAWDTATNLAELDGPDLRAAQLSLLPPEEEDIPIARRSYRTTFCERRGIDPSICDRTPDASYVAPNHVAFLREEWCAAHGETFTSPTTCADFFESLDQEFSDEWQTFRSARIAAVPKPHFSELDLRRADLNDAELSGIAMVGARMDGADLRSARMEGADLRSAWMVEADLSSARMVGADLRKAWLVFADLSGAQMQGVNLSIAEMQGAVLFGAHMEGANLSGAHMQTADLSFARMEGADLGSAQMDGADLSKTVMARAVLVGARMVGADLSGAQMQEADLSRALLTGSAEQVMTLSATNLSAVRLSDTALRFVVFGQNDTHAALDFRTTFGDATVELPIGVEPPCQWAIEALPDELFFARWRGWIERSGSPRSPWTLYAPEQYHDITPIPPPAGCTWEN